MSEKYKMHNKEGKLVSRKVGDENSQTVFSKLMFEIDNVGGEENFTTLNQMLFALFIEQEGGITQYIEKYKNLETTFKWHHRQTAWIFIQADLNYNKHLKTNSSIEFSADLHIRYVKVDFENHGTKEIDCLSENCDNPYDVAANGEESVYDFKNFIEPITKNPYDVVLIHFVTGIDELGIKEGTYIPMPAFFFYAALINNNWTLLKRDLGDIAMIVTSYYAAQQLILKGSVPEMVTAYGTLFFNTTNAFVMTKEVRQWLQGKNDVTRGFLDVYKILNLVIDVKTVDYSISSFESIVSSMALYFDGEGAYFEEFEKPFMEKFPEEYKRMVKELNNLK